MSCQTLIKKIIDNKKERVINIKKLKKFLGSTIGKLLLNSLKLMNDTYRS